MAATRKTIPLDSKVLIEKGFNIRNLKLPGLFEEEMAILKKQLEHNPQQFAISVKKVTVKDDNKDSNIDEFEIYENGKTLPVPREWIGESCYLLTDGERRYRCMKELFEEGNPKRTTILVDMVGGTIPREKLLVDSYLKNQGSTFKPIEEGKFFCVLVNEYNYSIEDVMSVAGVKSKKTITSKIRFFENHTPKLELQLAKKEISQQDALEIINKADGDTNKIDELLTKRQDDMEAEREAEKEEKRLEKERKKAEKERGKEPPKDEIEEGAEIKDIDAPDPLDEGEDCTPDTTKDDEIAELKRQLEAKDEIIKAKDVEIHAKDELIKAKDAEIESLKKELAEKAEETKEPEEKEEVIEEKTEKIDNVISLTPEKSKIPDLPAPEDKLKKFLELKKLKKGKK